MSAHACEHLPIRPQRVLGMGLAARALGLDRRAHLGVERRRCRLPLREAAQLEPSAVTINLQHLALQCILKFGHSCVICWRREGGGSGGVKESVLRNRICIYFA